MSAKFVPRLLMVEQKDDRVSICTDLREWAQNDSKFMSLVVTGNKSWVHGYDPETKQMSTQWKIASSHRPKKAWRMKSNVKTMLIAFLNIDGLVHHEYVPRGQAVNNEFYKTACNTSTMLCADIALRSGVPAIGPCTMTMPLLSGLSPQINFWQNTTFCPSHNLPTPLSFLHATSCSRNWRKQWNFTNSMTLKRLSQCDETNEGYYKGNYQRCFHQWQERWNKCIQAKDTTSKETRPTSCLNLLIHSTKSVPELYDQSMHSDWKQWLYEQ